MKRFFYLSIALFALTATAFLTSLTASAGGQSERISAAQVKSMIEGLGYELKTLNSEVDKEKYEFTITRGGYDIPVAAEISPSKNYLWLTVFLGPAPKAADTAASKFEAFLKANFDVQPCQFYITTKGNLMMAIALDNRNITAPFLKTKIDKIVDDTVKKADLWK